MKKAATCLGAILLSMVLGGCSWWQSSEDIEPTPLVSFSQEAKVKKLWSTQIGSGLSEKFHRLRPGLSEEMIFAADIEGHLLGVDRSTGKVRWKLDLETPISGGVGVGNGRVAVATYAGDVLVFAADTGAELWRAGLNSEALSPPQFNQDTILIQTIDGRLTALELEGGKQRWSYDVQIPALTLRGTSTPLVTQSTTYAGFANGNMMAFDNRNGDVLFSVAVTTPQGKTELERMVDVDGSMQIGGNLLFVGSYQGHLAAVSATDGRLLWKKPLSSYQGIDLDKNILFAADADDDLYAFNARNGAELWQQVQLGSRRITAPVSIGDTVAVADAEGYLHFMSKQDGHFVARERIDSSGINGPLIELDSVIYVLGNSGRLIALTLN